MSLGETISAGASRTMALFHLNGSGTDSSGNSNDGTLTNGSYAKGRLGSNCLSLTGTGYLESADSASLDTASVWISYWFNPNASTSSARAVVSKGYEWANQLNYASYFVPGDRVNIRSVGSVGRSHITPSGSVPIGTWTKLDLAVSNGDTVPKMWVNGEPVTPTIEDPTLPNYVISGNSNPLRIGSLSNSTLFLDGFVDEMEIQKFIPDDSLVKRRYTYSLGRFATL